MLRLLNLSSIEKQGTRRMVNGLSSFDFWACRPLETPVLSIVYTGPSLSYNEKVIVWDNLTATVNAPR